MSNLKVNIAGVEFKNPVITASGCFGFGREYECVYPLERLGGISLKGMTFKERLGNPPPNCRNSERHAQLGWFAESWCGAFSQT